MIYVTGDIHGRVERILYQIQRLDIQPEDTIVLLGDAGLNYYGNYLGDWDRKKALDQADVTIFCIHGNHEMRPESIVSYRLREWRGGQVYYEEEFPNLLFAKDGEVYDLDGKSAIVMGGAYSVDKYYRVPRGYPWFEDEQPSEETKRRVEQVLDERGWKVDLVLSHTCPAKYIPTEAFLPGLDQASVDRSTEDWLDVIEDRLDYRQWYCGHWHINKRVERLHFLMEDYEVIGEEN